MIKKLEEVSEKQQLRGKYPQCKMIDLRTIICLSNSTRNSMNQIAVAGFAGVLGLCALKRYCNGGLCTIRKDLTGQVAIVTGGNIGVGRETALGLARQHCTVIILARDVKR